MQTITQGDLKSLHYLLGIIVPEGRRYMVLESDIECLSKAVHVIDFSVKSTFDVGRRVTNDITVSEISVSRMQATIQMLNNKIYITDNDSKFGTFLMVQDLFPI